MDTKNPKVQAAIEDLSFEVVRKISEVTNEDLGKVENLPKAEEDKISNLIKSEVSKQTMIEKSSLISVFGIFASIISFLTIEFQFLKTLCSIEKITGFTLIIFSLLLGFNFGLDYLIKTRTDINNKRSPYFLYIIITITFIIGIIFTFKGNEKMCNENKVFEKYNIIFSEDIIGFQSGSNARFQNIEDSLKVLSEQIKIIKDKKSD